MTRFHRWYDRLAEPWRFLLMLAIVSPCWGTEWYIHHLEFSPLAFVSVWLIATRIAYIEKV